MHLKISFIPLILLAFLLILATAAHSSTPASTTNTSTTASVPALADIAENLGVQVRKATIMRADLGTNAAGEDVFYTVLMGQPATLVAINANTGAVEKAMPLPGTSGAWGVKASPDGTVYFGAYNAGYLYRFFPKTDELKNLGFPFPNTKDAVIYPMDAAPDGKLYGGVYPSGHAYEYDPETEKFRDLGQMTNIKDEERWIRATAYDKTTNRLYFGIGNTAQLVEYDLATGNKRDLLPTKYSDITSVYDLSLAAGKLFCRKETHHPNEYFVLDSKTGAEITITDADTRQTSSCFESASRAMSPISPIAQKVYFSKLSGDLREYDLNTNTVRSVGANVGGVFLGYGYTRLTDPEMPGYSLVGLIGMAGRLAQYNLQTGKVKIHDVQLPANPINIHEMEKGPDGKIYTGGFLAGNAGIHDPKTGESRYVTGVTQSEGMTVVGNSVFFGTYPDAAVFEYDTTKPWDASSFSDKNPKKIMDLAYRPEIPGYAGQDRPFGMAGSAEMQKLFVGTVPKNKMYGGVFAVYDLKARTKPDLYPNLIKDQSIISLVYKDGIVYGGTSIIGGMGGKPRAKEAVLFGWDVAKKQKLFEIVPVSGKSSITSLLVRPDGNIWGFANGTLFIFDPQTRKVTYSKNHYPKANGWWIEASMVSGVDGNVYAVVGGNFIRIDANTKQVTPLATGARQITRDDAGDFYLSGSPLTELYKVPHAKVEADNHKTAP